MVKIIIKGYIGVSLLLYFGDVFNLLFKLDIMKYIMIILNKAEAFMINNCIENYQDRNFGTDHLDFKNLNFKKFCNFNLKKSLFFLLIKKIHI